MRLSHASLRALGARLDLRLGERAFFGETAGEDFAGSRMSLDALVHFGLRVGWFVRLIMSEAAVSNEIDERVAMKAAAILNGQVNGCHRRFHVIGIDVDDRYVKALGEIACIPG